MQKRKATLLFAALLLLSFLSMFSVNSPSIIKAQQVDPSVVGTSTSPYATFYPFQRKGFYANGRFWVFYSDGANFGYRTSADGITWSDMTVIKNYGTETRMGFEFSVWFDGTYIHYAFSRDVHTYEPIYYRRGTPNADGTITWSTDEQVAVQGTPTTYYSYIFVSVDSNGYPWIAYRQYNQSGSVVYYPFVTKSQYNNGIWSTQSGFPYQLSTTSNSGWRVSIIPLTAGKMLAVYAYPGSTVKARVWTGSAWGTEVATTSAAYGGPAHSAVAQGDDVHLVFLKSTGYDIIYTKYTYSSNSFGSETTLVAGATSTSAPVISIDPSTNNLYVFAATTTTGTPSGWTANHIYYIKYTASSGSWGSWTDWLDETTEVLTAASTLTGFYQAYGNQIGLMYVTKTASPYNVKFALVGFNLNVQARDLKGNIIENGVVYVNTTWRATTNGWANFTIVPDVTVQVAVKLQGVWVSNTSTVTMNESKTVSVVCKVYSLTIQAFDLNGKNIMNADLELFQDTTKVNGLYGLPSSPRTNATGYFVWNQLANTSYTIKTYFQGILVNETSFTLNSDKTINVTCNLLLYSLTVKVQTASGLPISDCPLELWRDGTLLNGLYSLPSSPKTDSNGMFTWPQLANQSSSYTIKSPWAGIPWVTTPLTQDTFIIITQAAPAPAPSPTPTPTPTPTPSPTPWAPPMQLPSPEQIKEVFMQFPILIIIPMSLVIVAYALIARRKS